MRKPIAFSIVLLAGALVLTMPQAAPAADAGPPANLVANGDFSQVADGKPDKWQAAGDASVSQTLRAATDAAGNPCAELACTRYEPGGPASHAMLAQVGLGGLIKGRLYEFSCRMRAEGLRSHSVSVAISDTRTWTNGGLQEDLPVGAAWRTFRRPFRAAQDLGPAARLQFWFTEPGTLWVANVRIAECPPAEVEFTDLVPPAGGRNLVANGSFEVGGAGWSSLSFGPQTGWGGLDWLHGTIERTGGTHGRAFLRIPLGGDRTPVLYFDYYEPVVRRELQPLAASLGWIKVEKGAPYTLSCDMRASADGVRAVLGARVKDPAGPTQDHTLAVKLSKDWKRHSLTFRPEHRYAFVFAGPHVTEGQRVDVDLDAVQLHEGHKATPFEPRAPVEFSVEPSQDAGIFEEGRPAGLVVRAFNHGAAAVRAAVKFAVTDFEDKTVPWRGDALEVPAGAAAERSFEIPADWKGFYRVRASFEAGGRTETAEMRLARVPRRTASDTVCGINHAFTSARSLHLAAKAGVTWYRDWSLKWQHIEPARGEFHWEVGDTQIDRVLREGLHVLPLLPPFPSADWSSEAPGGLPTTGYPGVRLRQAWAPRDPADLAAFIEKAVARYKDHIHIWQFLNEPIYTDYALPADRTGRYGGKHYGPADYVALLERAAAAMRKSDPRCKVIGGIGSGPLNLTREILEAGCLRHIDILDLHMYPGSRRPEAYDTEMAELEALMDRHGGRKPVWVTEFSYYAADRLPRRPFFPSDNSWSEHRLLAGERECADFTVRFLLVMLAHGVQKVFIHSGSSGHVNEPNFECALFDYGGAPRKLFAALAALTELLGPAPSCAGERRFGESGWAVAFETGRQSVIAVWSTDEDAAAGVEAPSPEGLSWRDGMGRPLAARPVRASSSPAYLVGPPGKAADLLRSIEVKAAP